jgi:3-isopropylmalate/(R)-2-methylmalate dehydratase small subunit
VIAKKTAELPGYSDIFRQNAANCGLLLVEFGEPDHAVVVESGSGASVSIDLAQQTVSLQDRTMRFEINPATKSALLEGLDLIGTTLRIVDRIAAYERNSRAFVPPASINR